MKFPAIYVILPFVMLGRVYYHCHWVGDTIMGATIGTAWGFFGCYFFATVVPILRFIAGSEFFCL